MPFFKLPVLNNGSNTFFYMALIPLVFIFFGVNLQAQELGDHQYTSESIQLGLGIYNRECALCHGIQGDLIDNIDLRLGKFRSAASDDNLRNVILEGRAKGRMPAFNFNTRELNGVIAYLRAGFDPNGMAVRIGDPSQGRILFEGEGECSSCHRVNGEGPRIAPDLSNIGKIRTAANLQLNLIDPAAAMLPINRPVRIVTLSEETIVGRRLNEDTYTVQLIDSEERLRSLVKAELLSYDISDSPSKAPTMLDSGEVADVIAYLLTLVGEGGSP